MKFAPLLVPVLLSACAQSVDAPTLLPRAVELADTDAPTRPAPAPALVAADPGQDAFITKALQMAQVGQAAFDKALPASFANAPAGSEAWIAGNNALSAAEVARAPLQDAIVMLDQQIAYARDQGTDFSRLQATRDQIQAMYDQQTAQIDKFIR